MLCLLQMYAPMTLASARDFWTLRYTTSLENGSVVVSFCLLSNALLLLLGLYIKLRQSWILLLLF